MSQELGSMMAPYPPAGNFFPHTQNHNYILPTSMLPNPHQAALGAAPVPANAPAASEALRSSIIFIAGLAVGGLLCWKIRPWYEKIERFKQFESDGE